MGGGGRAPEGDVNKGAVLVKEELIGPEEERGREMPGIGGRWGSGGGRRGRLTGVRGRDREREGTRGG